MRDYMHKHNLANNNGGGGGELTMGIRNFIFTKESNLKEGKIGPIKC
jgi:hypothetical protein